MPEQIGKIEKPATERFKEVRKVYLVPLIYSSEGAPTEYKEKYHLYWQQVADQLGNLETKIGRVDRVYHESVSLPGEDGMKIVEKLNLDSYQIVKGKCDNGATFEAIEDDVVFHEAIDWERCLSIGFMSEKVMSKVLESYVEASTKRYESMANKITETLKNNEAGLLLIREEHRLQFAGDIEVISVFPPMLDEIHRWLRDRARIKEEEVKD
jgi:hypothetical protein